MIGAIGYAKNSRVTQLFTNLTLTVLVTRNRDAFVGAIGACDACTVSGISANVAAQLTKQIVFGGLVGVFRTSSLEHGFSSGEAALTSQGYAGKVAGLLGQMETSTLKYAYTHMQISSADAIPKCVLGVASVLQPCQLEEIICL